MYVCACERVYGALVCEGVLVFQSMPESVPVAHCLSPLCMAALSRVHSLCRVLPLNH